MADTPQTADLFRDTENYLKGYGFYRKLISSDRYEQQFFRNDSWEEEAPSELSLARARMFEIRHFIMAMDNCDEKLLLYYHYIKNDSIERCAELLGISRSSAFRLKKRGIMLAAKLRARDATGDVMGKLF